MAFIKALTYYLPETIRTNEEIIKNLDNFEETGISMTKSMGVDFRHVVKPEETAADIAEKAALHLFSDYNITPQDIDFLIYVTQGPDYSMPSSACILQDRLMIPTSAGAFGIDLGCSGYVYGLAVASSFVESGLAKNVLLLTADTTSKYINQKDKNLLLFGDGASASVISDKGFAEIGKFELGTDGKGFEHIIIRNGGWRHRNLEGNSKDWFYMDGEAIFNFTVECIPPLIKGTLSKNNLQETDIDYYVFHQANKYMLNTLRKLNGIPKDQFFVDLSDTGNTASSTVPIGLKKSIDGGAITKGMKVMLAGFGVGLSWGGTILQF